jgi:hypothetical protein
MLAPWKNCQLKLFQRFNPSEHVYLRVREQFADPFPIQENSNG